MALGAPALAEDPRFVDNPRRVENRAGLAEALASITRTLAADDIVERMRRAGVPAAPILTVNRVATERQTEASGMLAPVTHPRIPGYRAVGLPIKWDGERPGTARVPPLHGEHTAEVLAELGYGEDAIRSLRESHVIGV
jgi:crotonobetainyl-CoA:carnitine CoA-transferase CaiB-like acyl-CoA transferase